MSVLRCPVCKAENAQGQTCRRCKADLSLLFQLEEQRTRTLAEARRRLAAGRPDEADALAEEADRMRSDAESRRLRAMTRLMRREFAGAWAMYLARARLGVAGSLP
jgi:methylphosphotriester-DNA--protein-cysteine methyltransferase